MCGRQKHLGFFLLQNVLQKKTNVFVFVPIFLTKIYKTDNTFCIFQLLTLFSSFILK